LSGPNRTSRPLVAIQHHRARADLLPRLVDGLGGLDVVVCVDDGDGPPNPWRGHLACLEAFSSEIKKNSHLVVIQDDALVCEAFECHLHCALEAEPDAVLVLFLAGYPRLSAITARRAYDAGDDFSPIHQRDCVPVVGVSYPAELVADVLAWSAGYRGRVSRSDDFMLGQWARQRKVRVLATVPSLVEHPDDVPSLIGNGVGASGRNPARSALFWPP
jgi:hypothetical protein